SSPAMPPGPRHREQARPWVLAVSVAAWTLSGCQGKGAAPRPLTPGSALYDQGKYAEALPLLAKAIASGVRDGTVLYQLGYCRNEPSEAEAAYRRPVSAYSKKPAANAAYHALALARVGDLDYQQARYDTAAGFYEEALKILPGTDQIQPFRHAIALLDSGKFD